MDSFRKQLISRFLEERRLTHPHLSLLFDLCKELIRKCHSDKVDKDVLMERLDQIKNYHINDILFHIYQIDAYYQRNIHNALEVDVETPDGEFTVGQLDFAMKMIIGDLTEIVTDIADMYYMDFAVNLKSKEVVLDVL